MADLAKLADKHEKELPRWVQGDAVMATQPDHIHMVGDGRGQRDVYLNGKRLKNVIYANTRTGKVRLHDDPPKVHKYGKRLIVRTLRGVVEVAARTDG